MEGVVLAAGKSERLKPLTETRPKHLIPLGGKTVLDYALENLIANKIEPIYVVVSYLKEKIIRHLAGKGIPVEIVEQKEQLGTGDALVPLEKRINEEFLVYYGDIVTDSENIHLILEKHGEKSKPVIALVEVEKPEMYGVATLKNEKIVEIEEKPAKPKSNLALAGIYVLPPQIFQYLRRLNKTERGEYELTDALKKMINEGFEFIGVKLQNEWIDIGTPWDLLKANKYILDKVMKPRICGEIEKNVYLKGKVFVGKGSKVRSGSYIEGPVYIGKNCEIGPNSYIRPFTSIEDQVKIGASVEVKNSIVLEKTKIPHLTYVGDSLIGSNCNFGAGTITANLRLDHSEIKVEIKGKKVGSGLRKLGVIMGDNVETGINVNIMPGIKIGGNSLIGANTLVTMNIPSDTLVYCTQSLILKKRK